MLESSFSAMPRITMPCLFIKDVRYCICLVLVSVERPHGSSVSPIPGLMHCWVTDTVSLPGGAFCDWQGETEDKEAYLMLPMGLGFRASALHCLYMQYLVLLDPTCVPTLTTDMPVNITLIVYFWLVDCLLLFVLSLTCYDPTLLELLCLKYVARMWWGKTWYRWIWTCHDQSTSRKIWRCWYGIRTNWMRQHCPSISITL